MTKLHTSCGFPIKRKVAVRCLHDCLAFIHKTVARWAYRYARLPHVQLFVSGAHFIGSLTFCRIFAVAVQ